MPCVVIRISICRSDLFSCSLKFVKLLGRPIVARNDLHRDDVVHELDATVFPSALIWGGERTHGDSAKPLHEFYLDVPELLFFDLSAVVVLQRQIDFVLPHTARAGIGTGTLLGRNLLKGILLRFRIFKCSSRTP